MIYVILCYIYLSLHHKINRLNLKPMLDQKLVEETIQDIQEAKDKILKRHEGDTTFSLRVDTVFNQLINSLGNSTGNIVPSQKPGSFVPKPLTNVVGQKINTKNTEPLKLPTLEVDKAQAFKDEIKLIHDGFLKRENIDLLDSLKEIQIRGVAKIAGVDDYETDTINEEFVQKIKDKIQANDADKTSRNASKATLGKDAAKAGATAKDSTTVKNTETPK